MKQLCALSGSQLQITRTAFSLLIACLCIVCVPGYAVNEYPEENVTRLSKIMPGSFTVECTRASEKLNYKITKSVNSVALKDKSLLSHSFDVVVISVFTHFFTEVTNVHIYVIGLSIEMNIPDILGKFLL